MKERPILFNGQMVRAILDGRKTQTRRVVKGVALDWLQPGKFTPEFVAHPENHLCPYGVPGDRLWVREAYRLKAMDNDLSPAEITAGWPGERTHDHVSWVADEGCVDRLVLDGRVRPSIHMPRWASRITRDIVAVRVERLNDISEADAIAEGVKPMDAFYVFCKADRQTDLEKTARGAFVCLWDSINAAKHPWSSNPWVWVVEFRRLEAQP